MTDQQPETALRIETLQDLQPGGATATGLQLASQTEGPPFLFLPLLLPQELT